MKHLVSVSVAQVELLLMNLATKAPLNALCRNSESARSPQKKMVFLFCGTCLAISFWDHDFLKVSRQTTRTDVTHFSLYEIYEPSDPLTETINHLQELENQVYHELVRSACVRYMRRNEETFKPVRFHPRQVKNIFRHLICRRWKEIPKPILRVWSPQRYSNECFTCDLAQNSVPIDKIRSQTSSSPCARLSSKVKMCASLTELFSVAVGNSRKYRIVSSKYLVPYGIMSWRTYHNKTHSSRLVHDIKER